MSRVVVKAPYGRRFVEGQRRRLVREREQLLANVDADEAGVLGRQDDEISGVNRCPADDATALTQQELDVPLLESTRYLLAEIDGALARMDDGTYGWDDEAGVWIREDRLRALPWARREIELPDSLEQSPR